MKARIVATLGGFIFAVGLALGGMLDTRRVVGFLDVAGDFDLRLALVMAGGIGVFMPVYRLIAARELTPSMSRVYHLASLPVADPKLVVGSILFGIGWALVGYCPGPALVSAGAALYQLALGSGAAPVAQALASDQALPAGGIGGSATTLLFALSMMVGMVAHRVYAARQTSTTATSSASTPPNTESDADARLNESIDG